MQLQEILHHIQKWLKKWRLNETKSIQVTFIIRKKTSITNSEWSENPSNRKCQIFRVTSTSQTKLEETYIYQEKTIWTITRENVLATRQQITTVD